MRVIESNHRYNLYNLGFHYILEFNVRSRSEQESFLKMRQGFASLYGPLWEELPKQPGELFARRRVNDNWRTDYNERHKRRRIYYKEQNAHTMVMLRI
jgi:hypothetical protein